MINDVITDLLIESPYYGYLAGRVRFIPNNYIKHMHTTFDNGPMIGYNKDWFDAMPYEKQKGAVMHELLHLALLHFMRRDGRDPILWHMACDIAVSELMDKDLIHEAIITSMGIFMETGLVLPVKATAEQYYERLQDDEEDVDYTYKSEEQVIVFDSGKRFDGNPLTEVDGKDLQTLALVDELAKVQMASQQEHALGEDLSLRTEAVYSSYKVNWRNVLKRFLTGQGRIQTRRSYKRVSRRYEDLPGKKRTVGLRALVAVDESGSISNEDVKAFHEELVRINGINTADITAVRFDTTCSEPVSLARFVGERKRTRRGGTDFRPVFKLADELKIPMVVLFTDGQGEAPPNVNQKVLWVLTNHGRAPVDYGMSIKFTE